MARRPCRRWISPRRSNASGFGAGAGSGRGVGAAPGGTSAIDVALRFLAARPRSEREIGRRLVRAGFDAATVEATLGQLRGYQLVDDAEFARYWVEQRQTFRPRGARVVRGELRRLGVSAGLAQHATQPLEPSAEDDAYRAAEKRAAQLAAAGVDARTFTSKLSQFLARRGFNWDTIATTVRRLSASLLDESLSEPSEA